MFQKRGLTQILKAGGLYFSLTFFAGFMLGMIRVLWLVPTFGTRSAELIEAPFMLVVIILAARWVIQYLKVPTTAFHRISVGIIALGLLLVVEFTFVLWVQGLTVEAYVASRDPVAGAVYLMLLSVCAVMPVLVSSKVSPFKWARVSRRDESQTRLGP